MARKKREEEGENLERWLVSYADFITLLFAFFVVMYAISSVNEVKYRAVMQSVNSAFRSDNAVTIVIPEAQSPTPVTPIPNKKKAVEMRKEKERMTQIGRDLMDVFSSYVEDGTVKVVQSARGVNVEISASVLFSSADAKLSKQSEDILRGVARLLKDEPNEIQVEGFTDNMPINSAQYPSNWELSSARASSVIRLFIEQGVPANRMVAIGRGENSPIEDNSTPEGRAKNRRISLTVLSTMQDKVTEIDVQQPNHMISEETVHPVH